MYDIAVIGAGASGLVAAISAKRNNMKLSVCIVEALTRVGKKILATGNGRCNLSNMNAEPKKYRNPDFTSFALERYNVKKTLDFFGSIGLMTVADSEGRIYPMSNAATSVLDALRFEAENIGVDIICEKHIDTVKKENGFFIFNSIKSKKIILATGGKSSPKQGSDGSGYGILKEFGHHITKTYPALVQLTVRENTKALKGIRVRGNVTILHNGKIIDSSKGEVLFTDYGLSGIAIMDISRSVVSGEYVCRINMMPELSSEKLIDFFGKVNHKLSVENALCGILPRKLSQTVLKLSGIKCDMFAGKLKASDVNRIMTVAKNFEFTVDGTKGFTNAQITAGGADIREFNPHTMESYKEENLYCCGEILDVDSVCGGYNLQWAWSSGMLAGESAAKDVN